MKAHYSLAGPERSCEVAHKGSFSTPSLEEYVGTFACICLSYIRRGKACSYRRGNEEL